MRERSDSFLCLSIRLDWRPRSAAAFILKASSITTCFEVVPDEATDDSIALSVDRDPCLLEWVDNNDDEGDSEDDDEDDDSEVAIAAAAGEMEREEVDLLVCKNLVWRELGLLLFR